MAVSIKKRNVSKSKLKTLSKSNKVSSSRKHFIKSRKIKKQRAGSAINFKIIDDADSVDDFRVKFTNYIVRPFWGFVRGNTPAKSIEIRKKNNINILCTLNGDVKIDKFLWDILSTYKVEYCNDLIINSETIKEYEFKVFY